MLGEDHELTHNCKYNFFSQWALFEKDIPGIEDKMNRVVMSMLSNPKSPLRLRLESSKNNFYYDKDSSFILLKKILHQKTEFDQEEVERYAADKNMAAIFFYNARSVCICCQHMFLDGVGAYNIVQRFFDDDHRFRIQPFIYIPFVNEAALFLGSFKYWKPTRRYLSYDLSYKTSTEYVALRFRHHLAHYKWIKQRCSMKVSFSSVFISKMLRTTFHASNAKMISFGVLVGMNSSQRFNNFGVVTCELGPPMKQETDEEYAVRVHTALEFRKEMAMASFIGSNIYGMDLKYGEIDMLFSGMPMTVNMPIKMNGVRLKTVKSNMRYTSMPVYCGYLSCDRYIHLYLNIRTKDIDLERYKTLLTNRSSI
jgi:hypothetical protein